MEKDLIELLKNIKYQTGYIAGSYNDPSMLSRMAIEDKISPEEIDSDIDAFCKKHNIKLEGK
tara:strand:- start:194 stop:379 length:186 start_codon:yes stop_codon:yes gene_type:complete